MSELKTLNDLGENECGFGREHIDRQELKTEAINIFNDSMSVEEFGKKMVKFFEIQEEDLK